MGLALLVGLAWLPTIAEASIQIFDANGGTVAGSTITLEQFLSGYRIDINNGFDTKELAGSANSFSSTNLNASDINITAHDDGGLSPGPGIVITGNFNAAPGTTQDTKFDYNVTVLSPSGFAIHDIRLDAAGFIDTGGQIKVTETATGTDINGTPVSAVMTNQGGTPGSFQNTTDIAFFTPLMSINIHKDILLLGGTGTRGTSLTDVTQRFSQTAVPEPSAMALAGLGALGFIGYGLRRRKALDG